MSDSCKGFSSSGGWGVLFSWTIGILIMVVMVLAAARPYVSNEIRYIKPKIIEVRGVDHAFVAPDKIESGWTTFLFSNEGKEAHHMTLIRLQGDRTLADFVRDFNRGAPMAGRYIAVGGPNGVSPGGQSNATMFLKKGNYALICFVPSPDGKLHLMKGMLKPLTVFDKVDKKNHPRYNVEMELVDYKFQLSKPIEAGNHSIKVTNKSSGHLHEVVLARVEGDATVEDVITWMDKVDGPPPAEFLGGIAALSPMQSNIFQANFKPGRYAWICPMIEGRGQKSHIAYGMYTEFIVR